MIAEPNFNGRRERGSRESVAEVEPKGRRFFAHAEGRAAVAMPELHLEETRERVVDMARKHPLPATMLAASLAWLGTAALLRNPKAHKQAERLAEKSVETGHRMKKGANELAHTMEKSTRKARKELEKQQARGVAAITEASRGLKHIADDFTDRLNTGVQRAGEEVRDGAKKVRRFGAGLEKKIDTGAHDHPFMLGLGCIALGFATATIIHRYGQESE